MIQSAPVTVPTRAAPEHAPPTAGRANRPTEIRSIGLVFLCTLVGAAAQILMKYGTGRLPANPGLAALALNLPLVAGFACYAVNTVLLVLALRRGHLSVLYPIIALTYVWVTILSPRIFHDPVNALKAVGVGLIVIGVSMIGAGSRA